MTDLTKMTAAQLAGHYFEQTGITLKPTSYTKAKWLTMIDEASDEPTKSVIAEKGPEAVVPPKKEKKAKPAKTKGATVEVKSEVKLTELLVDPKTFDPESDDFTTLNQIAKAAGIKPSLARSRIRRKLVDDKAYTRYIFPNKKSVIDQVLTVIS